MWLTPPTKLWALGLPPLKRAGRRCLISNRSKPKHLSRVLDSFGVIKCRVLSPQYLLFPVQIPWVEQHLWATGEHRRPHDLATAHQYDVPFYRWDHGVTRHGRIFRWWASRPLTYSKKSILLGCWLPLFPMKGCSLFWDTPYVFVSQIFQRSKTLLPLIDHAAAGWGNSSLGTGRLPELPLRDQTQQHGRHFVYTRDPW